MLRVRDLVVRYGDAIIVRGVSFDVPCGRVVALIGPNGAGKTTCFNAINGQVPAAAGQALFADANLLGLRPAQIWALGVGRTFQVAAVFASMTVRENVQMGLIAHRRRLASFGGAARRRYREEADVLLDAVGMREQAERPCGVLAYGDLKRLELAIALTNDPKLLLMDEPTAGMAPRERAELMQLTAQFCREKGIAVLVTDHDVDTIFRHADDVHVLDRGEIIASGAPADIRADRRVQQVYLGGGVDRAPALSEGPKAGAVP